jgi:hypothetical protein
VCVSVFVYVRDTHTHTHRHGWCGVSFVPADWPGLVNMVTGERASPVLQALWPKQII